MASAKSGARGGDGADVVASLDTDAADSARSFVSRGSVAAPRSAKSINIYEISINLLNISRNPGGSHGGQPMAAID